MCYLPTGQHMFVIFLFIHTATTELYTLSLHDALPIFDGQELTPAELDAAIRRATIAVKMVPVFGGTALRNKGIHPLLDAVDRKSTRLNSSHLGISYAVFCLKKKKKKKHVKQ